jgi:signal transduction histidine kinase/ActR/RegA family two-component response regulator
MSLFVPEETMVETREMIQMVRQGQRFSGVETKRYTKRGEAVPVSISGASYTDRNGRLWGSIINIRDVRTQKSLEAQLQQAQKMEAVGTLASGIAHDFNNLLQAMSGNVQLLIQRAGRDSDLLRYLNEVDQAVVRASDLVRRLLTFSRKVKPLLTPLDLGREIQATISLLERTIPKMIQIDLDMDQDLHPVFGDPGQIQQVLLNLASNAKDAMPEGGRLGILARNVLLSDDFCRLHADLEPGAFVQLVVQDTGVGMNEETLSHIFEPFFTTKEVGRGTGLGLSSIYGIMKSHRGFIQCHSRLGEGSRFDLYFPAGSSQVPQVSPGPPAENKTTAGQETILLVDDERAIRQVARDYLEECGYHILEADSGEAALAVFTQDPRRIDMVILDLGMPGMGGQRCLREILGIYPTARVVIASGYSTDGSVQESLALGARSFLGKPYRLSELLEKVRGVLGGDAAAQAAFPDST